MMGLTVRFSCLSPSFRPVPGLTFRTSLAGVPICSRILGKYLCAKDGLTIVVMSSLMGCSIER